MEGVARSMDLSVLGLHHVTAVTADAAANLAYYTGPLGMRLVKKSVNQDDVQAYHLFYADAVGTPGTDLTFFDWPASRSNRPGPGAGLPHDAAGCPPGRSTSGRRAFPAPCATGTPRGATA